MLTHTRLHNFLHGPVTSYSCIYAALQRVAEANAGKPWLQCGHTSAGLVNSMVAAVAIFNFSGCPVYVFPLAVGLQAYYEAVNNGPVNVVPLAPYVSDVQCPYPKPAGGDMNLPSWLYSPQTGKCYYKSSFAKGISNNINDAVRRCTVSPNTASRTVLKLKSYQQPAVQTVTGAY